MIDVVRAGIREFEGKGEPIKAIFLGDCAYDRLMAELKWLGVDAPNVREFFFLAGYLCAFDPSLDPEDVQIR